MSDYTRELNTARKAATAAAKIIRKFQDERNFAINFKGKNDLVTEADLKSEEQILSMIKTEFPEDHILAEESSDDIAMPRGRVWLIDPIDGTTNFAHGFPIYCVSIGLWEDGEPKMGLVLQVASDDYFTALAGGGAYCNDELITVSGLGNPQNSLIGTGFPYRDTGLMDHNINFFRTLMHQTQGVRRAGAAAYDLCLVACGQLDGFYEYSLWPWDVGAAALIVKEAGGLVSDWQGSDNWLFGKRIIAGNPEIYAFLLEGIREHFLKSELTNVK